eukprot:gene4433-4688_t
MTFKQARKQALLESLGKDIREPARNFSIAINRNQLTGTIPSPLPGRLRFFDAAVNQLSGPIPEVAQESVLHYLLLGNNKLSGLLPVSLINGSAGQLEFLDIRGNNLEGRLDGSVDSSASEPDVVPPPAAVGSPWTGMDILGYVDLSGNKFSGPVPAALAALSNLVYLDVSHNDLSGSLKPFADVLAASANSTSMVYLDVSSNELTGPIPAGLSSSAILDPNIVAEIAHGEPAPRVLSLSNNQFSGPFPSWLITQPPLVQKSCSGCRIAVFVNGSSMQLTCPEGLDVTPQQLPYLQAAEYQCRNSQGQQVALLSAAASLPASTSGDASNTVPASLADLSSPFYSEDAYKRDGSSAVGAARGATSDKLGPGGIAGVTIGSVLVAGVLALAAVLGVKRYRKHRMGWRKDDLNGVVAGFPPVGPDLGGPFVTSQLPPSHSLHVPVAAYPSGPGSFDGSGVANSR